MNHEQGLRHHQHRDDPRPGVFARIEACQKCRGYIVQTKKFSVQERLEIGKHLGPSYVPNQLPYVK